MSYGITPVFYKNYQALNARNSDGSRKFKYIINTGSSRSSKTFSIIELAIQICNFNKNFRFTAWRDTKKDAGDTIWKDFQKVLHLSGRMDYKARNKTEKFYSFPNNTTFEIHGADDEEKVHGLTQNVAWLNEPYKISKDTFDQIDQRSDLIIIDWNPKKNHWIDDLSKRDNAIVIHSTFKDNPFCPIEQKNKILSYLPISFCEVVKSKQITEEAAEIYDISENKLQLTNSQLEELHIAQKNKKFNTADPYKWEVYGLGLKAENPKRIYHNFKKISREKYDAVKSANRAYYGLDFGFANATGCMEVIYAGDETFYLRQKLYKPMRLMTAPLGEVLLNIGIPVGPVTYVWADSADKEAGSDISQINDLRTFYNINAYPVSKPTYKARFEFINKCQIFYCESSDDFESEYEDYEYEYINDIPTERPIKKNDHLMNAMEYAIWGLKEHLGIVI